MANRISIVSDRSARGRPLCGWANTFAIAVLEDFTEKEIDQVKRELCRIARADRDNRDTPL